MYVLSCIYNNNNKKLCVSQYHYTPPNQPTNLRNNYKKNKKTLNN